MARAGKKTSKISTHATLALWGALTILLFQPSRAPAQDLQASIHGSVSVPSGTLVPGASVPITEFDEDFNFSIVSNQAGRFSVGSNLL